MDRDQRPSIEVDLERVPLAFVANGIVYNHFDWQKMVNHIGAVVPVVLSWLNVPMGVFGTGQQRIMAGLLWRQPIKFPPPPRMPSNRIEEMRRGPDLAAIGAHGDLRHLG